jgi:hypothetical protein
MMLMMHCHSNRDKMTELTLDSGYIVSSTPNKLSAIYKSMTLIVIRYHYLGDERGSNDHVLQKLNRQVLFVFFSWIHAIYLISTLLHLALAIRGVWHLC